MPLRAISAALILLSLSILADAQSFTRAEYAVGGQPSNVVSADFNGDGVADLAVTNSTGNYVTILLGRGDGTFGSPSNVATAMGPTELVSGDFNADGKADLAIAVAGSTAVTVLLGNGDGTFRRVDSEAGGSQVSLAAGDFNGDGKTDLAAAIGGRVQILQGTGDGTFTMGSSFTTDVTPKQVRAADLNADGKLDLAIGACCQGGDVTYGAFYVYAGNGDGTFSSKFSSDQSDGTKLIVADVTGDGLPDLIMPYLGCHTPCQGVEVAINSGNFSFTRFGGGGSDNLDYGPPGPAMVGDFNGDGKLEVGSPSRGGGEGGWGTGADKMLIWTVGSDGKFTSQHDYLIGQNTSPEGDVAADFNHDGKIDFAVVEEATGKIAVFLNNTGAPDARQTFDLTLQSSPQTMTAGNSAKYPYVLEATNGTLPQIQLSCSGLPTGTACQFDTAASGSFTQGWLTITTTPPTSGALRHSFPWLAFALPFGFVLIPGRSRKMLGLGLLVLVLAVMLQLACGGGSKSAVTPTSTSSGGTSTGGSSSGGTASGGSSSGGTTSGGTASGGSSGGTSGGSAGTPSPAPSPTPTPAAGPTPSGNYQITVTATGGGVTQSQVVTLAVQ